MLNRFKRPEHIGDNRCYPCTVVNLGILAGICGIVATLSWVWAILIGIGGIVAISLRGYLVPFTPRFGPRLKSALSSLASFERTPTDSGSLSDEDVSGETVMTEFLRAGVLAAGSDDELRLSTEFEAKWKEIREEAPKDSIEEFAQWAGAALDGYGISTVDGVTQRWFDPYLAVSFESGEEVTLSYPKAIAEISALFALQTVDLPDSVCLQGAGPLRAFLDRCPRCDARLEASRYSGCCGNPRANEEPIGLVCPRCTDVLFKYPS